MEGAMPEGKRRILVVDDDADFLLVIAKYLESEGYDVSTTLNGMEALTRVRQDRPDLILLDINMPKQNGFQVCKILKHDAQFKEIPIMLLSARAETLDKEVGRECGSDAYMTKPYDSSELIRQIKKLLESTCNNGTDS